jgi:hypothetical protein
MTVQHSVKKVLISIAFIGIMFPLLVEADPGVAFVFGNHIDTHQYTSLKEKDGSPVRLNGDFLILFTGDTDPVSGLPIARHPRGASQSEECGVDVTCDVGWDIKAVPGEAKFLFHSGVNGEDHPVWLVNRVEIPQPGSYTHFHWITAISNDPRFNQVPDQCDVQSAGELENNAENVTCPGWFMQITAVRSFAFQHGNEIVPVERGKDNATHLNLLTNYAVVDGIDPTR